ncbi:hypothetical protein N7447_003578 [Penicillium robsamsonii]|uniref:uncharacterized protein n=1 Tax=Penicillium robsamsonii TaxID=1792511 RepID=UPI0025496AA2|nr:uncharacterized protein N7447_003578 [Penicillium robsamsonii]KAJ5826815.1 hypothetical protein N7447_003578 [Penicillium robsamsonii]
MFDFDSLCFLELSQDQHNHGDSWPSGVSWPDELVTLNDVTNPVDPPSHLDPDFDLLWSQLNEEGLDFVADSSEPPHLSPSPSTSLAPPPQTNPLPWTPPDIFEIGYQDTDGDWRCNYSGCLSNRVFLRACDLRKHYRKRLSLVKNRVLIKQGLSTAYEVSSADDQMLCGGVTGLRSTRKKDGTSKPSELDSAA